MKLLSLAAILLGGALLIGCGDSGGISDNESVSGALKDAGVKGKGAPPDKKGDMPDKDEKGKGAEGTTPPTGG